MISFNKTHGKIKFILPVFVLAISSTLLLSREIAGAQALDPIVAYGFNDGANPYEDSSPSGINLLCDAGLNCPAYAQTGGHLASGGFDFSGAGTYLRIPQAAENLFDFTNGFTISFWMKVTDFTLHWEAIIAKGNQSWAIERYGQSQKVSFSTYVSGAGWDFSYPTINLEDGNWHHYAAVFDGQKKRVYIDGNSSFVTNYRLTVNQNNNPVTIGLNPILPSRDFGGNLDDVRIYGRALTQVEVLSDMQTPVNPPSAGTPTPTPTHTATPAAPSSTPVTTASPTQTPPASETPNNTATPFQTATSTPTSVVTPTGTAIPPATVTPTPPASGDMLLRVSQANSRYFENNAGEILLLTGSHTWQNLVESGFTDPPQAFDYTAFLDFLEGYDHNFFKLWAWEQPKGNSETADDYWYSPQLYARVGPGLANDGKPKFDLTQFNQAYFDRMRSRIIEAGNRGIYVSIMFFNGWSVREVATVGVNPWIFHPYNSSNNINNINGDPNGNGDGNETHSLVSAEITALQEAYIRKVVDTVQDLDNVLFEISNESHSGSQAWQYHLINYIKAYEAANPNQHPVGMTVEYPGGSNGELFASPADWISLNGNFKFPPIANGSKVILADTDHLCGLCGDDRWVWKSFTSGENPIWMDNYDGMYEAVGNPGNLLNDPASIRLRRNLGYIRAYSQRMDLAGTLPIPGLVSTGYALGRATPGGEYLVYLEKGLSVTINLSATPGLLSVEWLDPMTGQVYYGSNVTGGGNVTLTKPFGTNQSNAVLYLKSVP